MILKNFSKALSAYFGGANLSAKIVTVTGGKINATTAMYSTLQLGSFMRSVSATYNSGTVFGDGDTPVKSDDYCLSGNVITGITGSAVRANEDDEDSSTVSVVYTIANNNTDEVVIKEVAVCINYQGYNFLMERTVLDSPITIPAGGVGQVTYSIRFNYPTA